MRKIIIVSSILTFTICMALALVTDHRWEDWYITFRASKNLAMGNGLVFTPGEYLMSYTSPLGTLIPAGLKRIFLHLDDDFALWAYRIVSAMILSLVPIFITKALTKLSVDTPIILFTLFLFIFNFLIIDMSINGMEAAFMVFFLAYLCFIIITVPTNLIWHLAICMAGLLYSRPDSFIYGGALLFSNFLFLSKPFGVSRMKSLGILFQSVVVAILIFLPWVIWTWVYYGTPIPNTISAKSGNTSMVEIWGRISYYLLHYWGLKDIFLPPYERFGGWNYFQKFAFYFSLILSLYWLNFKANSLGRALSFALFLLFIYQSCVTWAAPWYLPSVAIVAIFVSGIILSDLHIFLKRVFKEDSKLPRFFVYSIGTSFALFTISVFILGAIQIRYQQQLVEFGNRKKIGLWLHDQKKPGDTVFMECLGYIGFYSGLKTYDWPGMSSIEMVKARQHLKTDDFGTLIKYLKPVWLVLRPNEADMIEQKHQGLLTTQYEVVKKFDVTKDVDAAPFYFGKPYLYVDANFSVFKLNNPQ